MSKDFYAIVSFGVGIVFGVVFCLAVLQSRSATANDTIQNHQKEIVEELQGIETELGKIRREME